MACAGQTGDTGQTGEQRRSGRWQQQPHNECSRKPHSLFISIGLIPTGIDKCNAKIMIDTTKDPDLFRVKN
jgi:hypothetical protein